MYYKTKDIYQVIMEKSRWEKIEAILDEALSLEESHQKENFFKKACRNDKQLYRDVTILMQSIKEAEEKGFLEHR